MTQFRPGLRHLGSGGGQHCRSGGGQLCRSGGGRHVDTWRQTVRHCAFDGGRYSGGQHLGGSGAHPQSDSDEGDMHIGGSSSQPQRDFGGWRYIGASGLQPQVLFLCLQPHAPLLEFLLPIMMRVCWFNKGSYTKVAVILVFEMGNYIPINMHNCVVNGGNAAILTLHPQHWNTWSPGLMV